MPCFVPIAIGVLPLPINWFTKEFETSKRLFDVLKGVGIEMLTFSRFDTNTLNFFPILSSILKKYPILFRYDTDMILLVTDHKN